MLSSDYASGAVHDKVVFHFHSSFELGERRDWGVRCAQGCAGNRPAAVSRDRAGEDHMPR